MSLTDVLVHHAERAPTAPAIQYEGRQTDWLGLLEETRVTAGALADAGVGRGDVVAVLLHNSDEILVLMHAASHLGAIFMPLNWRLAGPELAYIIDHAEARVLVTEDELMSVIEPVRGRLGCGLVVVDRPTEAGWSGLGTLREQSAPRQDPVRVAAEDVCRLMYTSGTTSRPKGVMITYGNLDAKNAAHMVEFGITAADVNLACGPLYHVGALDLTTTTAMYVGAPTVILRRFEAGPVLDAIERHRVSCVWLAPAMIKQLIEGDHGSRDLTSMRLIVDGGEKMPLPLIEAVLAAFPNAWFADAYGLTETVSGDTVLDKGRCRDKLGSVGKPVIHTEVAVLDDDGRPVPAGGLGEVVLRGPKVFKGYWRNEGATDEAIRAGWFHTGDIGMLDDEGFLFIVDRLKDVIVSGGENVASSEVERVLYEHPAVAEAAAVARPDPRWGEVPVAYVSSAPGESVDPDELISFCAARLAKFKVPKAVLVVDELPRNPSGKVLKRELRDREREFVGVDSDG